MKSEQSPACSTYRNPYMTTNKLYDVIETIPMLKYKLYIQCF